MKGVIGEKMGMGRDGPELDPPESTNPATGLDLSRICGWADITKRDASGWWGITGKGTQKRWCLSLFLKVGRVEMDERWPGSLFQTLEATDENDLDFAIPVFSTRNT